MQYEVKRYLTKKDLKEINDAAVREKRNRALTDEFVDSLDESIKLPITDIFYHAKDEIRLMVLLNGEGSIGFIDVSTSRYETIPIVHVFEDGTYEFQDRNLTDEKRPYPNGREWKEVVTKQPVRKQASFRKNVLGAYQKQCAICEMKEVSLLRAAHIIDVSDGGTDELNNGLCLCVNHELAYDKGLLFITDDYQVISNSSDSLGIAFNKLRLPKSSNDYPSPKYLKSKYMKLNNKT